MLETLIAQASAEGFHINFLHQNFAGLWQVSLREADGDTATYPCIGEDPAEALSRALTKARTGCTRQIAAHGLFKGALPTPDSKIDLAAMMGIGKIKIERRF